MTPSSTRSTSFRVSSITGAAALLMAGAIFATPSSANAASTFASWTSSDAGSLDGVGFTVTGLSAAAYQPDIQAMDMSGAEWNSSGSQQGRIFPQTSSVDTSFTITFDSAVSNLEFYLYYFRGGNGYGYDSYTFSESFSVTSGLTSFGPVTVTGSTIDTSGAIFASGILSFNGPVTSLTINANFTTGFGTAGGDAGFTMAQNGGAPAVPGIGGVAALAAIGCGRRRRR
jgi:hypothetical protein